MKTAASRRSWQSIGPDNGTVPQLVADPTDPSRLYAGTRNGVFRSLDRGSTWSRASTGLPDDASIRSMALDPSTGAVYVTLGGESYGYYTSDGFYRSVDGGDSWIAVMPDVYDAVVAVAPSNPDVVYLATSVGGGYVYRSDDGGTTWPQVGKLGYKTPLTIAVDPVDPDVVYVGYENNANLYGRLVKTTNGGEDWTGVPGLPHEVVPDVAVAPWDHHIVFAVTERLGHSQVYRSFNAGRAWTRTHPRLSWTFDLSFGRLPDQTVLAGGAIENGHGFLMESRDVGDTWTRVSGEAPGGVLSVVALSSGDTADVIGTEYGAFTNFRGNGWSATSGLFAGWVDVLTVAPSGTLYAGIFPRLLVASDNGGRSWTLRSILPRPFEIFSIAEDPFDPTTLYVCTQGEVFRSLDSGRTWDVIEVGGAINIADPIVVPDLTVPNRLHLMGNSRVYISDDGGDHWTLVTVEDPREPFEGFVVDPVNPDVMYTGGEDGLHKSVDGGATWQALIGGGLSWDTNAWSIAMDPRDHRTLYASVTTRYPAANSIYRTHDAGKTWEQSSEPFPAAVTSIVVDPARPSHLYASTYPSLTTPATVYRSVDGAVTWSPLETTPGSARISLAIDPAGSRLYAGTVGASVFALQLHRLAS